MDKQFWREKWQNQELGWHLPFANPVLKRHLPALDPAPGARVFVPLCGKTLDIRWLLEQGFAVAGAELSEQAVRELFEEHGMEKRYLDIIAEKWQGGYSRARVSRHLKSLGLKRGVLTATQVSLPDPS